MPHISRHVPTQKVSDGILERFVERAIARGSVGQRRAFLLDLMTPTERIMFSKRFAMIYMLVKGYSFDDIQEVLRVSPSTISRLWVAVQKGKYAGIVQTIRSAESKGSDVLGWLLDLIPPMHQSKKQYAERMRRLGIR